MIKLLATLKYIAHEILLGVALIPVFICLLTLYLVFLFFYLYPRITWDGFKYIFTGKPTSRFDAYMNKSKHGFVKFPVKKFIVKRKTRR